MKKIPLGPDTSAYLLQRHAALMQAGEMNCLLTAQMLDDGVPMSVDAIAGLFRDTAKIIGSGVVVLELVAQVIDTVEVRA